MIERQYLSELPLYSIVRLIDTRYAVIMEPPSTTGPHAHEITVRLQSGQLVSLPSSTEVELVKTTLQSALVVLTMLTYQINSVTVVKLSDLLG